MKTNYIHITSSDGYIIAVPARFASRLTSFVTDLEWYDHYQSAMNAGALIQLEGAFVIKGRN